MNNSQYLSMLFWD